MSQVVTPPVYFEFLHAEVQAAGEVSTRVPKPLNPKDAEGWATILLASYERLTVARNLSDQIARQGAETGVFRDLMCSLRDSMSLWLNQALALLQFAQGPAATIPAVVKVPERIKEAESWLSSTAGLIEFLSRKPRPVSDEEIRAFHVKWGGSRPESGEEALARLRASGKRGA